MNSLRLVGETLDGKYRIERELGKGGMGTVYFAIHLGTERPVAIKVIVPQFMQKSEFVERFRREARAAGRLRHPNVVDVTDFGFAETAEGKVAYLVMEYLDGCTLGEILDEEKQLPLSWTLDILEQVSSAVHEAHLQGIIHRDLKPDNIWLEPNQRGGYTVKVLDFGIAKLEETVSSENKINEPASASTLTQGFNNLDTVTDNKNANTIAENQAFTNVSESRTAILNDESGTLIQTDISILEKGTAILSDKLTRNIANEDGTKLLSVSLDLNKAGTSSANLTRIGAVLGTPLYMSPEQCRGEKLTSRSDIYSLAIIAYQMLGGKTPFAGEFTSVMESHKLHQPPPLEAKKVPRKVKKVIHSALSKSLEERPLTAEAFASELRSHSEGFGQLLQRALVIYSEHLPKFLLLALLVTIPHIILVFLRTVSGTFASVELLDIGTSNLINGFTGFLDFFVQIFAAALMVGTTTWLVAQILAAPLKPVSIRAALKAAWEKKKPLFTTVTVSTLISIIGIFCCVLPGVYFSTIYMLIAPSIMMENISGKSAFKRSHQLVKRSFLTALATAILIYLIPAAIGGAVAGLANLTSQQLSLFERVDKGGLIEITDEDENSDIDVNFGPQGVKVNEKERDKKSLSEEEKYTKRLTKTRREVISQSILELFLTPVMILLTSLTSVITALMYFKTRQAGGESMQDLLSQCEDTDRPQSNWQSRIKNRLEQSGKITSKSS
jgi:serine/threonine protein kinase